MAILPNATWQIHLNLDGTMAQLLYFSHWNIVTNVHSTELEVKHSVTINKVFHFTRKVIEWTNNLILEPDHLQMTLLNWDTESRSFLMLYTSFFSHEIMAMEKSYLPEDFLIKTILVATQTSSKFDFKNYHKISLK